MRILKYGIVLMVACAAAHASVEFAEVSAAQAIRQADSVVIGRMGPLVSTEQVVLQDQYDDFGNLTEVALTVDVHEFTIETVVSGDVGTDVVLVRRVRAGDQPHTDTGGSQMIGLQNDAVGGKVLEEDQFVVVHDVAIDAPPESVAQLSRWAQKIRTPAPVDPQAVMELAYADTGNFDTPGAYDHADHAVDFLIDEATDDQVIPNPQAPAGAGPREATVDDGTGSAATIIDSAEHWLGHTAPNVGEQGSSGARATAVSTASVDRLRSAAPPQSELARTGTWLLMLSLALGVLIVLARGIRRARSA